MSTLSILKIQTPQQKAATDVIRAAAAFAGVALEVNEVSVTEVVKLSPFNIMPVLTNAFGNVAGLAAVKSVDTGCSTFSGRCPYVKAQIDQYLQIVPLIVDQVTAFKALEASKSTDNDKINALNKLVQLIKPINNTLVPVTFLLGNNITLADVILAVALKDVFALYMGPKKRAEMPALTRWFNTVAGQKAFLKTFGAAEIQDKDVHLMPDLTAAPKPQPKKEDPISKMARSPMSIDAIKKLYMGARPYNPEFNAEFWPQFDAEGWECFEVDFMYEDDFPVANKLYMAENCINGFITRGDGTKRNVFLVLNLYQKGDFFLVKGAAIIRGNREINADLKVPYALSEVSDAEEYSFKYIDTSTDEGKAKFIARFCADKMDGEEIIQRIHLK